MGIFAMSTPRLLCKKFKWSPFFVVYAKKKVYISFKHFEIFTFDLFFFIYFLTLYLFYFKYRQRSSMAEDHHHNLVCIFSIIFSMFLFFPLIFFLFILLYFFSFFPFLSSSFLSSLFLSSFLSFIHLSLNFPRKNTWKIFQ